MHNVEGYGIKVGHAANHFDLTRFAKVTDYLGTVGRWNALSTSIISIYLSANNISTGYHCQTVHLDKEWCPLFKTSGNSTRLQIKDNTGKTASQHGKVTSSKLKFEICLIWLGKQTYVSNMNPNVRLRSVKQECLRNFQVRNPCCFWAPVQDGDKDGQNMLLGMTKHSRRINDINDPLLRATSLTSHPSKAGAAWALAKLDQGNIEDGGRKHLENGFQKQ